MLHRVILSFLRPLSLAMTMLAVTFCGAAAPVKSAKPADALKPVMDTIVSRVKPALVRLHVVSVDYYEGREVKEEGYGSGFLISPQGYVITNHHVAGNAVFISCTMSTREEIDATLVGTDPLSDIAVVKLTPKTPRTFPYVKFGDSAGVRVGDRVIAMGSPLSFSQSVTMGVVSNTELIMPDIFGDDPLTLDGEDVGSIVRWIAHDAQIFPGNSGGPLVNERGEVIGVNEISMGLAGAIPGNLVHNVADQLIAHGKVKRAYLGMAVQPMLKSAAVAHGILITDTAEGSPAEKAGCQSGDILIRLHGQAVDVHFKEELPLFNQMAMALPVGKPVAMAVVRDGKTLQLTITPEERPAARKREREYKIWGICACAVESSPTEKADTPGIRVTGIRTGSPAGSGKPGLLPGDIILKINNHSVKTLDEFETRTAEEMGESTDPVPVLVTFKRDDEEYVTVVRIGLPVMSDTRREVRKAWLPVNVQVLTKELATALGLEGRTGVRVTEVYPQSAAETAGIKVGDLILAVDGEKVDATQEEDTEVLAAMVRQYKIGSKVELSIVRDGTEMKLSVELPQSPKLPREMARYREENYDFTACDIAFNDRMRHGWDTQQNGVLIESVGEGGWAALGRLRGNDLLVAVNGKPVNTVAELATIMADVAKSQPELLVMKVMRNEMVSYLELQSNWPKGSQNHTK